MNATEQRNHKRVTDELAEALEQLAESTAERIADEVSLLRSSIGDERTHRLKLADEQRSYVDSRDRELRDCCQERWNATNEAVVRVCRRGMVDVSARDRGPPIIDGADYFARMGGSMTADAPPTPEQMAAYAFEDFMQQLADYQRLRSEFELLRRRARFYYQLLKLYRDEIVRCGGSVDLPAEVKR